MEVFAGFAASEVVYDEQGRVKGVATNDVGISKSGEMKDSFMRGMELHAKQTLFAEGARGSCTKQLFEQFNLRENCQPQTFGLGVKEVWQLDPSKHDEGLITHSIGWPSDSKTWAGSFFYHGENNLASIGYVVALDYANPYISPYQEFQRFKHHPSIAPILEGGQCLHYGGRTLNEGGLQSIPRLTFPGGALIGCCAGFLNVAKIKGTHTAMKSGITAAEAIFAKFNEDENALAGQELVDYESNLKQSWVYDELREVRNVRPSFNKFGGLGPMWFMYSGLEAYVLKGRGSWTFDHHCADHEATEPAAQHEPIKYPTPDGVISFDILSNVARSGTNHEHDQPVHLNLKDKSVPGKLNLPKFDGPEGRFCPAKVYEYVEGDDGERQLVINAQNCLHCKACDIKDPSQNINWCTPEGGGGPKYVNM